MKFNKEVAVGIKFYVGSIDIEDMDLNDFTDNVKMVFNIDTEELEDSTGLFSGDNALNCKYYDEEEGELHMLFDTEVDAKELLFFEDEEIIFKKVEE